MSSIIAQLDRLFRDAIRAAWNVDADPLIAVSGNEKFGDYQSNAAMGLAKTIAEKIKASLNLADIATEVSIAGPGFINVRLNPKWLEKQLSALATDRNLG